MSVLDPYLVKQNIFPDDYRGIQKRTANFWSKQGTPRMGWSNRKTAGFAGTTWGSHYVPSPGACFKRGNFSRYIMSLILSRTGKSANRGWCRFSSLLMDLPPTISFLQQTWASNGRVCLGNRVWISDHIWGYIALSHPDLNYLRVHFLLYKYSVQRVSIKTLVLTRRFRGG